MSKIIQCTRQKIKGVDTLTEKKKFLKVPHTYVIIFTITLIAFVGTYIIPAGEYQRMEDPATGRMVVDAESFEYLEPSPVPFFSFSEDHLFTAVFNGMESASNIIFFILIVGGAFAMIQGTGAIDAGIGKVALALKDRGIILIPVLMAIFSVGGATIGMAEEVIVFVPIGVALARALGYDAIVGTAMISLGAAAGFTGGVANPFTVGVAQGIAEVPIYSAAWYRVIILLVILLVSAIYTMRYAVKVKKDPSKSLVADLEKNTESKLDLSNIPDFTKYHVFTFLVVLAGFGIMIYGIIEHDWYIKELTSIFLMMGIFSSLAGGIGPSRMAGNFVDGAKTIVFGAMVVGIARGILVVMEQGLIIDTVIFAMGESISGLPAVLAGNLMFVVQLILNFFIPSGSGQAATTMPIMAPLADLLEMPRQIAVFAYQFGDGFTNSIIPTSGVLMSYLAIAKIPYEKWFRWILPLMGMWFVIGVAFMSVAVIFNIG